MFSLFGKDNYTNKCIKILNKDTGLDPLIAQAFIEDFKVVFDEQFEIFNEPEETLINSGYIIINAIAEEEIKDVRVGNKCRIFEKVAVKINQWSLEQIDDDHELKNSIINCLKPFTKNK